MQDQTQPKDNQFVGSVTPSVGGLGVATPTFPPTPVAAPLTQPQTPSQAATTPGHATTEFWLTVATIVLLNIQPYVENWPTAAKLVALALTVLAALGYTGARSYVKVKNQP